MERKQSPFVLPSLVVGPADIRRLQLELEELDGEIRQAFFRVGRVAYKLPKTSRTLDALAERNSADLLLEPDRARLMAFLESLQQHAPVIQISFAAEPSAAFTIKIVEWMRANISSFVLVQIGLQPAIAVGCTVRTPNKVFDLSLGRFLRAQRHVLRDALVAAGATPQQASPQTLRAQRKDIGVTAAAVVSTDGAKSMALPVAAPVTAGIRPRRSVVRAPVRQASVEANSEAPAL